MKILSFLKFLSFFPDLGSHFDASCTKLAAIPM